MNHSNSTMILVALQAIIITSCFSHFTAAPTASSPPPHGGFTIDLIHRRSNSSSTTRTQVGLGSPYADTVFASSEYLMRLSIGTPPYEFEAVLDTGSDLIWTQCLPCLNCYDQGITPKFDPSKSSTYKDMNKCKDNPCSYEIIYGDKSYSKGTLATETVTIQSTSGEPFVMPGTTIGCGHNNSMTDGITAPGFVGLSWGSLSLNYQMGEKTQGLFSYCLSGKGTSKINFGANAVVSGGGTVSTDMFQKLDKPNFYYLNLNAISVGDNRVETLGTSFYAVTGNIFIDSGTTYTYLPGSYCNQVMEAIENVVTAERVTIQGDMLCYNSQNIDIFPVITMHFFGADLVLDKYNIYLDWRGAFCVTIMCVDESQDAIFGNRAQNNLLVGYDTSSEVVSFKPTDCSALWS